MREGYKISDLGEIPASWEVINLGDVATFSQGIQVDIDKQITEQKEGYVRFIRIVDYTQSTSEIRYVENFGERYFANSEDIVMIRYGTPGLIGRRIEGIIANNMFKINFQKNVDKNYAEHYFTYPDSLRRIVNGSGSSTMPAINFSFLKTFKIIIPPLFEQQKIATILSTVDEKIEVIEEQIKETETLKKGLMQQLLTKGIGHTKFKDSPLGEIPESWEVVRLEDITEKIGDGLHSTPKYVESSQCYFVNGNNLSNGKVVITDKTKCISEEEYRKHYRELSERTVLLSINGTIGNVAFYKGEKVILGKSAAYISSSIKLELNFLFYYLQSEVVSKFYRDELTGSTISNLSLKSIRNTPTLLPSLSEQKIIAEILIVADSKLDSLILKKEGFLELKKGLMQQLLTGKMRVKI